MKIADKLKATKAKKLERRMKFTVEVLLGIQRLIERASIYPPRAASLADAPLPLTVSSGFQFKLSHRRSALMQGFGHALK
jgi:hypothetical protein